MTEILGKIEHTAEVEYTSFLKREPVVLTHLVSGPVAGAASLLVTHGVISSTVASNVTQQVVAYAVTGAVVLQGFLIRRFVKPAWKKELPALEHYASEISQLMDPEPELDETPESAPAAEAPAEQVARLAGQTP